MNVAIEQLLTNRATGDLCHKELDLNKELVAHLNEAQATEAIKQATEAIKQAKVCHTIMAYTLEQAERDSLLGLECQTKVEEKQDCQAFVEAFGVPYGPACPRTGGHFCIPYSSWLVLCC